MEIKLNELNSKLDVLRNHLSIYLKYGTNKTKINNIRKEIQETKLEKEKLLKEYNKNKVLTQH